jgi:hypothetical protein
MLIPLDTMNNATSSYLLTLLLKITVGASFYIMMYAIYIMFIDKKNPTHAFIKRTLKKQKPPPDTNPDIV